MTLSINSSTKKLVAAFAFLALVGCSSAPKIETVEPPAAPPGMRIAVFPMHNLTGRGAPFKKVRLAIIALLKKRGFEVLPENRLEAFMARHRIRYIGGVDEATAGALRDEENVRAVLVLGLESYMGGNPPKIALMARLVSAETPPKVLWSEGVGISGNDAPGFFGVGLVTNANVLTARATTQVADSLARFAAGIDASGEVNGGLKGKFERRQFQPRTTYRSEAGHPEPYKVAIVPFFNRSARKNAGEIMALHFMNELKNMGYEVVEPGAVRDQLLKFRIIMDQGINLPQTDILLEMVDADMVITGRVIEYSEGGIPKVDFSAMGIERKSREIAWALLSQNKGDDAETLFQMGKINTAHALASKMIQVGRVW